MTDANPWAVSGQRFPTIDELVRAMEMLENATGFLRGDYLLLFNVMVQSAAQILAAQATPEARAAYYRLGCELLRNAILHDLPAPGLGPTS